jgi:hypothetical protein
MKEIRWDNPNKMHMESGFKLFDKQTNLISTGNVFANTQRSVYIAPWKETKRNYRDWKEGELTKADLKFGGFDGNLPSCIKRIVYDQNRTGKIILYAFRVFKNGIEDVVGYVVTDDNYNYIEHCITNAWTNASYSKREMAIREAMSYICR